MNFVLDQILLNATYCVNAVALLIKDILWLRVVLMVAQSIMIGYAVVSDVRTIALWNGLFLSINTVQVIRILLDRRPIVLPESLTAIYSKTFSLMGMREFLYFWNEGEMAKATNDFLCVEGETPKALMFIMKGNVRVMKSGVEMARLHPGSFVSEMSFITGDPASADVVAIGEVDYVAWDRNKLAKFKKDNPDLLIKLQTLLGKDLTDKLKKKKWLVADNAKDSRIHPSGDIL